MVLLGSCELHRISEDSSSCGEIDRISDLPNILISNILSLLPTKDAVSTCVLSTRWNLLWTYITNVDFDIGFNGETRAVRISKFTNFVNRVLPQLNPLSIHNFRLVYYPGSMTETPFNDRIFEAFESISREMVLNLVVDRHMMLPLSHIKYCNIVVLKLKGGIHFYVPAKASVCFPRLHTLHLNRVTSVIGSDSSVSFPNLKIMHLKNMEFASDDSVNKLLSSCPVLDYLVFKRDDYGEISCLRIRIPSLTRLTLDFKCRGDYICEVEINTPALEYLHVNDFLLCKYLPLENFYSLHQAEIILNYFDKDDEEGCTSIYKFIGSLSNVKFLSASDKFLKAIRHASTNISLRFNNLVRLELKYHLCTNLTVVINLLESMENLEHIVIKGWECICFEKSRWIEPPNVPKCLLSRLTTVSFDFVCAQDAECWESIELLRYLLKNGEVLQLLTIITLPDTIQMIQKKISMFRRASKTCQVAFT